MTQPQPSAVVTLSADAIATQLTTVTSFFEIPKTVNISETLTATLTLDPSGQPTILITPGNHQVIAPVGVTKIASASLSSPGFEVISITPERQAVSFSDLTVWKWSLKPLAPGAHVVHLDVTAIVVIDDEKAERSLRTYTSTVEVNVAQSQKLSSWLNEYWQWIVSTLLLPLIGWLWTRRK